MRIKAKLNLGVGLLFTLILLLGITGAFYINQLSNDTENILKANANTLDYSRQMLLALEEDVSMPAAQKRFEESLGNQQRNVTESGEDKLTAHLTQQFEQLKLHPHDTVIKGIIRRDLTDIMFINMQAIEWKSNVAKQTARTATTWVVITGTLCFLIAFTLLINLPGNIANPIRELTASIRQIAAKNYSQRVHFEAHNEFGELARSFNSMAEMLEEYNNTSLASLLQEKKRIETLINNMNDPVIGLDEKKKVLFANDEALKITGMKKQDLVGYSASDAALKNDLLRSLLQQDEEQKLLHIFANNKESYFEKEIIPIAVIPTGEKEKRYIGSVIMLRNITPFKELDVAKTNFIATVSHELKTPISSIKMSLQLLNSKQTGIMNEEQQLLLDSIKDDSERLLKITGELLNLSQVETGNIKLSIQQTDPKEILSYALEAVKITAEQKQMQISTTVPVHLPLIMADKEKTAWVLINLLTNAIRYSPAQSEVEVHVETANDTVSFLVKDFGQGIDSRYTGKIFERYFRIPGGNKEGTGLGLAISKEFIEAQGGKIWVESIPGTGSTFGFRLHV